MRKTDDAARLAALTVPCPVCRQPKGQPCVSRHGVSIHAARTGALRDLEKRADRLLREN